jgi:hypothetical protein
MTWSGVLENNINEWSGSIEECIAMLKTAKRREW